MTTNTAIRTFAYSVAVDIIENKREDGLRVYLEYVIKNLRRYDKQGMGYIASAFKSYVDQYVKGKLAYHGIELFEESEVEVKNYIADFALRALLCNPYANKSPNECLKLIYPLTDTMVNPLVCCSVLSNTDVGKTWLVDSMGVQHISSSVTSDFKSVAMLVRPKENLMSDGFMEFDVVHALGFDDALPLETFDL